MEELIPITFFMCVAAVLILRPVTKRLGLLLEAMAKERHARPILAVAQTPGHDGNGEAAATLLAERVNRRLDLIEERMEFVERLADARVRDVRGLSSARG